MCISFAHLFACLFVCQLSATLFVHLLTAIYLLWWLYFFFCYSFVKSIFLYHFIFLLLLVHVYTFVDGGGCVFIHCLHFGLFIYVEFVFLIFRYKLCECRRVTTCTRTCLFARSLAFLFYSHDHYQHISISFYSHDHYQKVIETLFVRSLLGYLQVFILYSHISARDVVRTITSMLYVLLYSHDL